MSRGLTSGLEIREEKVGGKKVLLYPDLRREGYYKTVADICLSVCLSRASTNSRTKGLGLPEIGRMETHRVTSEPGNLFRGQKESAKVKVTVLQSVKTLLLVAAILAMYEGGYWNSHAHQPCCSSVAVPLDSLL